MAGVLACPHGGGYRPVDQSEPRRWEEFQKRWLAAGRDRRVKNKNKTENVYLGKMWHWRVCKEPPAQGAGAEGGEVALCTAAT